MHLLAPFWLGLLLPWAAAWVWAGRTEGRRAGVPHLPLWPRTPATAGPRRRVPPVWVMCLLIAALLAIFAAAGPAVVRPATTVTLLVDRGPSMSPARRRAAAGRLALPAGTRVHVVPVQAWPAVVDVDAGDLGAVLDGIPVDPLSTAAQLQAALDREVLTQPVVVLTDRGPTARDPAGAVRVGPGRPLENAGIDRVAVVAGPPAQAMVRVYNGTPTRRAVLRVDAQALPIELPATGATADYFMDLPDLAATATASLETADGRPWADDVAADDVAVVRRTARPGRLVPRTPLDASLARMTAIYAARRVPEAGAPVVAIVRGPPPDGPAVILPESLAAPAGPAAWTIDGTHPLARAVDFTGAAAAACAGAGPPGGGWTAVVSNGAGVLLAVRDRPARQVWVGFDTAVLAHRPDYVVLWTNVFDYVAGGAPAWTADPGRPPLAVRPAPPLSPASAAGVQRVGQREVSLIPAALIAALSLTVAGLWIGFRLTRS